MMELLQIATALVITKCDGQLLQSVMDLLQSAMVLTNSIAIGQHPLTPNSCQKKVSVDDYFKRRT